MGSRPRAQSHSSVNKTSQWQLACVFRHVHSAPQSPRFGAEPISGPTGEGRNRAGPSSRDEVRALQPLLHRIQERRWVTTILDLRVLNRALHKLPFRMLTQRCIFQCVHPFNWFAAIDLKDAYFHVSILPRHRPFSALRRTSIPVQGPPLRAIPAQSRALLCEHRDMVLSHLSRLGLQVNRGKSKLSPTQTISFLGTELDVPHSTSLKGARSVNAEMPGVFPAQEGGFTETFSEAPGAYGILSRGHAARIASYETASALASRPGSEMGMAPRHVPGLSHPVLPPHLQPMVGPCFLLAGVPLEQVSRHVVVSTDASTTGWGGPCATGMQLRGSGQGPSCSGISIASSCWQYGLLCAASKCCYTRSMYWSVWTTLRPLRTSTTKAVYAPVAYRNSPAICSFGVRSIWGRFVPFMSQASSIVQPTSSHISPPFRENGESTPRYSSCFLTRFGDAQVDLFASLDTSHCQLFFYLSEGTLGTDALAFSWPRGLRKYAFPPVSLLAQTLCKVREDEEQVLLVAPYWPNRTWFPELMLLATAPPWQIPVRRDHLSQRRGTLWHPRPPPMVSGQDTEVLGGLPPAVVNTITSARALSTRHAYRLKWNLFVDWCSPHWEDIYITFTFSRRFYPKRLTIGEYIKRLKKWQ